MNTRSRSSGLRSIIIVLIALFFFGGISITGVAAQSAIPGDALYSVKTSIEQTRLTLANDASDRAEMNLSFAEERLEEISLLIKEGRNREIKNAVLSFEANINSALIELETVAKGNPTRATELAMEITSALTRYAQTLSVLAASAPDSMKDDVIRAFDSTQLASSLDMPSVDDNSNMNANDNNDDNGNENVNMNGNENGDDHGNDVGDDNSNSNVNENGDDHGNDVGDDNSNLNANDNGDDQGNDNATTNADDDSNDNSNSNTNSSVDDNSNSNTNTNTNTNDNGGNSGGNDNGGDSGKGGG
jgi:AcrR family transcriptional regulator